jgi:hypothetical protein
MEHCIAYTDKLANIEIRSVLSWDIGKHPPEIARISFITCGIARHIAYYKRKEYEDILATIASFEIGSPEREEYLKQRKEIMAASREVRLFASSVSRYMPNGYRSMFSSARSGITNIRVNVQAIWTPPVSGGRTRMSPSLTYGES